MRVSKDVEAVLVEFKVSKNRFALARRLVDVMGLIDSNDLTEKISEILGRSLTEEEEYSINHLKEIMLDSGMFLGWDDEHSSAKMASMR